MFSRLGVLNEFLAYNMFTLVWVYQDGTTLWVEKSPYFSEGSGEYVET